MTLSLGSLTDFNNFAEMYVVQFSLLVVIAVSVPGSYARGVEAASRDRDSRERAAEALSTYESRTDAELRESLECPPDSPRRYAYILDDLDYNVFAGGEPRGERTARSPSSPGRT